MPHELGTQLVKDLVKMVARPSTTRADVNAILGAAGVGAPEDHLTRLPRDRVGVIFPVSPEQGMALGDRKSVV